MPTPAKKTLTVIQVDGTTTTHEPANGKRWTLDEWRKLIGGGWVEKLYVAEGVALFDEEGLLKGQLPNHAASLRAGRSLVGIVAFGAKSVLS